MFELKEKEKILLVKQRHPIIIKLKLLPFATLFFLILVFAVMLPFTAFSGPQWMEEVFQYTGEFSPLFYILFLSFLVLFLFWQIMFVMLVGYFLDCWIITGRRTIHTELHGLFNRYVSSIYHDRIQDVSVDVRGILPTYLNYGNLQVQTAGRFREFIFRDIPQPYQVKKILIRIQRKILRKRSRKKQ